MTLFEQIATAEARLRAFDESYVSQPYTGGTWTRKQLLGHLIDSAANNHIRFVTAALQEEYRGPGYKQEECVRLHAYGSLPWTTLVDWWATLNQIIVRVVEQTPPEKLAVICHVGNEPAMPLDELIAYYRSHMQHHLEQLFA